MTPHAVDWISLLDNLLPVVTATAGGIWALIIYIGHQKDLARDREAQKEREGATQRIESQKPFLELQLRLYVEVAQVAGKLIAFEPPSDEWMVPYRRFWALYWSEIAMVENKAVEKAMDRLAKAIYAFKKDQCDSNKHTLRNRTYDLAHAIRASIESAWGADQTNAALSASFGISPLDQED